MAPYVSLTVQRTLSVKLPPIRTQRSIARRLSALDDKIELDRRMNCTLESIARAIFKSWFVDFGPVRKKMEGRDVGLPYDLAALFPNSLIQSELGDIPAGWAVRRIEDVAERVAMGPFGSSIKVETFVDDGVPIISGQHLGGLTLEDGPYRFIQKDHATRLSKANVRRGDVVFTHAGNIGQVAFIPESSRFERYVISQRQFYLRCDVNQVNPPYIALYFHSAAGRHRLLANASSSGVPSIARPVTYLRSILLPVPPKPVMDGFLSVVTPLLDLACQTRATSQTLAALRDGLLPRLLDGRVPCGDRKAGACVGA